MGFCFCFCFCFVFFLWQCLLVAFSDQGRANHHKMFQKHQYTLHFHASNFVFKQDDHTCMFMGFLFFSLLPTFRINPSDHHSIIYPLGQIICCSKFSLGSEVVRTCRTSTSTVTEVVQEGATVASGLTDYYDFYSLRTPSAEQRSSLPHPTIMVLTIF